jgi:hypothetical protein
MNSIAKKHKPIRTVRQNLLKILKDESRKLGEMMENKQHKHVA